MSFYSNRNVIVGAVTVIVVVLVLHQKNNIKESVIVKYIYNQGQNQAEVTLKSFLIPNPKKTKNCTELLGIDRNKLRADLAHYREETKKHNNFLAAAQINVAKLEGYTAQVIEQLYPQYYLARLSNVKTVCETGFNGGHSTLLWLTSNYKAKVYSFDIGVHNYARVAAERLNKTFISRLTVTWGDSTKTLPAFIKKNPQVKCDFIIIDGGHSYEVALADFVNFKQMAAKDNVVLLDDYPCEGYWCKGPGRMWKEKQKAKEVVELAACSYANGTRGYSIGKYIIK